MNAEAEILEYLINRSIADGRSAVAKAYTAFRKLKNPGKEPTKRIRISKAIKFQIYKRQNGRCADCKEGLFINEMEIEHYDSLSQGGSNSKRNLRGTCKPCNLKKASHDPIEHSKRTGTTILEAMPKGD